MNEQIKNILKIFKASKGSIRPHFTLSGSSGSGKTFQVTTLAKDLNIPLFEINAAQLTKEGYSGNSLSKELSVLQNYPEGDPCICFVDEFDKLYLSDDEGSNANSISIGVQNEFLKVLEGDTTATFGTYGKYVETSVSNVLFVFAGAFNGKDMSGMDALHKTGIKKEFLGRVGLHYHLDKPSIESIVASVPKDKVVISYLKHLKHKRNKTKIITELKEQTADLCMQYGLGYRAIPKATHEYFISHSNYLNLDTPTVSSFFAIN